MKTQPPAVKGRGTLAVLLLFCLMLIPTWGRATEGKQGNEASSLSQKEQAHTPTRPYNHYALFIAGLHNPQDFFAAAENSPVWSQYARSLDESWKEFEVTLITPVKEWAARELSAVGSSATTVFYPFSGADFAFMYGVFPKAGTYLMISLERVGRIPDFSAMGNANLDAFLTGVQRSNQDLFHRGYFITRNLETAFCLLSGRRHLLPPPSSDSAEKQQLFSLRRSCLPCHDLEHCLLIRAEICRGPR